MMTPPDHIDQPSRCQRLHERFERQLPVRITVLAPATATAPLEAIATNISSSGAFVETNHPLPAASRIQLDCYISLADLNKLRFIISTETLRRTTSDKLWVRATGIVIRQQPNGMAIIFDDDYQLRPMHDTGI